MLKGKLSTDIDLPVVAVYADALVETKEGSYLYCGLIKDFFLSKDNGLDRVYFKEVYRRKLDNDLKLETEEETSTSKWLDDRYYSMPGEFFVIPYAQIKSMNVRYLYLIEEDPDVSTKGTSSDSGKE